MLGRIRIQPTVILLAILIILGWSVVTERSINQRRQALSEVKQLYTGTLTSTRTQLAGLLRQAATNSAIGKHLQWNLKNSLQKSLEARLQRGSLDQITIFDKGCNRIARATHTKFVALPCPFSASNPNYSSFFWLESHGHPVLALSLNLPHLTKFKVTGLVHLNQSWLSLYPALNSAMTMHELTIGPAENISGTVLVREGLSGEQAVASLGTTNFWTSFLETKNANQENPIFWPCLLSALALVLIIILRDNRRARTDKQQLETIVQWAYELNGQTRPGRLPRLKGVVETVQLQVSKALQKKIELLRRSSDQRETLETKIKDLKSQMQSLTKKIQELSELDSLAVQMQESTEAFSGQSTVLLNEMELLQENICDQLTSTVDRLIDLLDRWQHGISERGARKFLRGLSETKGEQPATSLLDDQLASMYEIADSATDQMNQISCRSIEISKLTNRLRSTAQYWRDLSQAEQSGFEEFNIIQAICEVQARLEDEDQDLAISTFQNHFQLPNALSPQMKRIDFVTALNHVYLAAMEDDARVATYVKERHGQLHIVITSASLGESQMQTQHRHLELARSILSSSELKFACFPKPGQATPIVLSWNLNVAALPAAATTHATTTDLA